jgi:branched-chain amino acid transport system substrate-binding protein
MQNTLNSMKLIALTTLVACASLVTARAAGADDEFPPYTKIVGIAVVAPLSGPQRQLGIDLSNGVQAAVADANAARSLTDFGWVMHSFDDQGDPGIAEQQAQFALVDPTNAIVIGHLGGQETALALHVYHESEIPLIIPSASLGALTQQGYDNVFRLCPPDLTEGALAARYVERNIKPANVAVVWEQDDYGNATATAFVGSLKSSKVKVQDFPVDVDLKTLKTVVSNVSAFQPDFMYVTGRGELMSKVLIALRKAGVNAQVMGTSPFYDSALVSEKDFKPAATGMLVGTCVPPVQFIPQAQVFQQRYQARFGRLSSYALFGYVAAQVAINAAVQARSSDKHALIRQLDNDVFQTVIGELSFRANGDPIDPDIYFYKVDQDANFKYVGSALPNPSVLR